MSEQPNATHVHEGEQYARWGQMMVPVGEDVELTPLVHSSANCVEFAGEFRIDFATAEAFIARLKSAIAYERARVGETETDGAEGGAAR